MDIFKIQLKKGVEMNQFEPCNQHNSIESPNCACGRTSTIGDNEPTGNTAWCCKLVNHGLAITQAEIMLEITQKAYRKYPTELKRLSITCCADHLASDQSRFIMDSQIYLEMLKVKGQNDDWFNCGRVEVNCENGVTGGADILSEDEDSDGSVDEVPETAPLKILSTGSLPLPSNIGLDSLLATGIEELAAMELKLWIGQANNALHRLCLALADKAVISSRGLSGWQQTIQ
ncbi:hypothetical protein EDC04DRAFT_2913234 [Pisolithus marmoratus]|nr:hypothetical protein EDC04DRAFT_2913234 [Pisolithus marmoratus]